jgi:hypothetical protein
MLVIVGMMLLLTWIIDHAFQMAASSLTDLLLLFACISFALDCLRERDIMSPQPGWDSRPPKGLLGSVARRFRRPLSHFYAAITSTSHKPPIASKSRA